jgi:ribonucleoside-diphosphate reductase alpha chain
MIKLDYSKDALFDKNGLQRLKDSYMRKDESSPQERYAYIAKAFGSNEEHSQRLYNYLSNHWLSASTPILSYGRNKKGLPISCFLTEIEDTAEGLVSALDEIAWLSMSGGGVGFKAGMRSADDKSVGVMPHLKVYDYHCLAYKQGTTRRGSYAAYLDIDHPDIVQFIEMRKPTGDPNIRCLNLHHGINISNEFMELIEECTGDPYVDDTWELKDPDGTIVKTISARELWQKLMETRMQTGEPYLHFIDTANKALPEHLKALGLKIETSNLCAEIELPTNQDRTAVCCLSSLNLDYWDQWKDDELFYRDVAEMLDNVLNTFIRDAGPSMQKSANSAYKERSIGVGVLGFHSLLQSKNIPFDTPMAFGINNQIFSKMKQYLEMASHYLATERGEAPDCVGTGKRFSHLMAVAPTASSSIIMGNTSPSIEPYRANAYRQDTASGSYLNKNKHLDKILKERLDEDEYLLAWSTIINDNGSVQNIDCLTEWEKDVFKTAMEIDQRVIVHMASDRAKYIDQGQSVNLFFMPTEEIKYIHDCHMKAWKGGVKSLYYCRSDKIRKGDKISQKVERVKLDDEECIACGS